MLLICVLVFSGHRPSNTPSSDEHSPMVTFLRDYTSIKYKGFHLDPMIYIAVKRQKMFYIENDRVLAEYTISTSGKGIGSEWGSNKTPHGLHRIREKVGGDVPYGGIIKEKVFTGNIAEINLAASAHPGDLITTRLFHLEGLEQGVNLGGQCDSYHRGIMIHGTPDEGLIGKPVSHGCIRMNNTDVINLFDAVPNGTYVLILNN